MVPTNQNSYTSSRLLRLTNSAMVSKCLPMVDAVREGFYSYDFDSAVSISPVRIPTRAVGAKLEDACFTNGTDRCDAVRYYEEDLSDYQTDQMAKPGFYLKRGQCFLVSASGYSTFRQSIIMRPNKLVTNLEGAQVTNINTGTNTVTCETVPSTWTIASILDVVQQNPHFDWLCIDQAITAITTGASGTIQFTSALPDDLAVGDWISLAKESPIVQLPEELHPLLAQETANILLKSQGDTAAWKMGLEEVKMMKEGLEALINPRVQKEGKKIVNRTGMLRRGL